MGAKVEVSFNLCKFDFNLLSFYYLKVVFVSKSSENVLENNLKNLFSFEL